MSRSSDRKEAAYAGFIPEFQNEMARLAFFSGRTRWEEAKRADPALKPHEHIERVYPDRHRGLLRADLQRIDAKLYVALNNWLNVTRVDGSRAHSLPPGFGLPTIRDVTQKPRGTAETTARNYLLGPTRNTAFDADDIAFGTRAIAKVLFGTEARHHRVSRLALTTDMPFFWTGHILCIRLSALQRWIEDQEAKARDGRGARRDARKGRPALRGAKKSPTRIS